MIFMVKGMTTIGIDKEVKDLYIKAKLDFAVEMGSQLSDNDFVKYLLDHKEKPKK